MSNIKTLVACFRHDELARASLIKASQLVEEAYGVRYGDWKCEVGCRVKRIDQPEMNEYPVYLVGEWGMNMSSFEPHYQCLSGTGIMVMSYDYGAKNFLLSEFKPLDSLRGVLFRGSDIAGFRKLVIMSCDQHLMNCEINWKILECRVAEAINRAVVDSDFAAALFIHAAIVRERNDSSAVPTPSPATA
jgi:hypothetical protein